MNTKRLSLILYLICIFTTLTNAQARQNGLVLPQKEGDNEICCIYSPKDGFKVFDNPNGKEIGVLTRNINKGDQIHYKNFFVDKITKKYTPIDIENFQETGYEIFSIKYFERKDGFTRIVNQSVNYWLSEKEINDKSFKILDWQQFLIKKSGRLMGYYANEPGLKLRTEPTTDSGILKKINGNLYEITPKNESEGSWTKVKVTKYKEHPCSGNLKESENIEYELEGWIKIVDDKGKPNVWYYARGC